MARDYPTHPNIGVGVIIYRDDGRVLLIKRGRPPMLGQWSLPGGGLELGETFAQTAAREAREECAVEIGPVEVLTAIDLLEHDDEGRLRYHYLLLDVLAPWASGEPVAGDDAAEVRWVSRAELAELEIWEQTRQVLEQAFERLATQR